MDRLCDTLYKSRPITLYIFIFSALFYSQLAYPAAKMDISVDLKENYRFIRNTHKQKISNGDKHKKENIEISPIGFAANGFLTIYQTFVSSQDNKVCNFTPSCSHFARDAINRAGFIKGSMMASDRLLRCHPYSLEKYRIDIKSGRAVDPVDYYIGKQ